MNIHWWERFDFDALRQPPPQESVDLKFTQSGKGPWLQLFTPSGLTWKTAELPIAHLPPSLIGLRVLHLSDLHMRAYWGKGYDQLIQRVAVNPPDLILFTGDFLHDKVKPRPALPYLKRVLTALPSKYGIYGVIGNHDPDWAPPYLAEMGVTILEHRRATIAIGDAQVEIIGLPGVWRTDYDVEFVRDQPPRRDGVPRFVLSHYPDRFPGARQFNADAYFAGHTHGGQICLPGSIPLVTHDKMPRPYRSGIHRIGRTWFIVSKGLGFTGPVVRLFCPAEAMELTLVRDDRAS